MSFHCSNKAHDCLRIIIECVTAARSPFFIYFFRFLMIMNFRTVIQILIKNTFLLFQTVIKTDLKVKFKKKHIVLWNLFYFRDSFWENGGQSNFPQFFKEIWTWMWHWVVMLGEKQRQFWNPYWISDRLLSPFTSFSFSFSVDVLR